MDTFQDKFICSDDLKFIKSFGMKLFLQNTFWVPANTLPQILYHKYFTTNTLHKYFTQILYTNTLRISYFFHAVFSF